MHRHSLKVLAVTLLASITSLHAAEKLQAKDIVLSRLGAPAAPAASAPAPGSATYGMSVSVLVLGPDGLLRPRSTENSFRTGEQFRLRILPTQDGTVVISNTDPQKQTRELLRLPVRAGLETLIPGEPDNLFQLVGQGGDDVIHLHLYPNNLPPPVPGVLASKDIRLVTQSTSSASYVAGQSSQPLYTQVVVRHQR